MMSARRFVIALGFLLAPVMAFLGCGGKFELPTEHLAERTIPTDKSYQVLATWRGMSGIKDILFTPNGQLFLLFGSGPRIGVHSFNPVASDGSPGPTSINLTGSLAPAALCVGGDGTGLTANQIFVLDQGDTCLARLNPRTNNCDTTRITNLSVYWHVRQFDLLGNSKGTFTDTSMAYVNGIAADANGSVYVSGLAIVLVPRDDNPSIRTRSHLWRIMRYLRGPRYPGNRFDDPYMPGADWHRDTTWFVGEGNGIGTVIDPRGIYWSSFTGNGLLYAADNRKNIVQTLSVELTSTGILRIPPLPGSDGSDLLLENPLDVSGDNLGSIYVVDTGNHHVNRYDALGTFVQRVDVALDADRDSLHQPVTIATDDSLAYVGDAATGKVIRYKRRP
jgi:hypothetical protein